MNVESNFDSWGAEIDKFACGISSTETGEMEGFRALSKSHKH